jgi:2-oxoisovalerate dehydrogenase E1 component
MTPSGRGAAETEVDPALRPPRVCFSSDGRPRIGSAPADVFAFGDLIRQTEQLILAQFSRGLLSGTTHTCIGQELCQIAVVRALTGAHDAVMSNHRNHGHFLTYSGDFLGLVAEVMGRQAGVCKGRGGSQHLAYRRFHSNGVQGGMSAIGVGLALANRFESNDGIVAIMVGDGTFGEGLLYESLNLAGIWNLRCLFVVEKNGIAQTTPTAETIAGSIEARGAAFGARIWSVDDSDPAMISDVEEIVRTVREDGGPAMLVVETRRMGPHSKGDDSRDKAELDAIVARDPLAAVGRALGEAATTAIRIANAAFVAEVEAAATASPQSSDGDRALHIFHHGASGEPQAYSSRPGINVRTALNEALRYLLDTQAQSIVLGEDLHDPYGGAFKVTAGLSTAFPGRVISTPISEAGVTGASIGLALSGYLPIMEVMFADFMTLCLDQLYNHAVKFPGVFDDCRVPLVIRTPSGGRRGYGPTHSQSPEHLLTSVPGLTVIAGSHRHDNGRLLVDAVLGWRYPVVSIEHKLLYSELQNPGAYEVMPHADNDPGAELFPTLLTPTIEPDITIITYGGMLPVVEQAVQVLEDREELSVEVLVPSLLSPLPRASLFAHLKTRARVLVAEESQHEFGISAEILAMLMEKGFRGRAGRVGSPPVPISSARSLEAEIIPDAAAVVAAALRLF